MLTGEVTTSRAKEAIPPPCAPMGGRVQVKQGDWHERGKPKHGIQAIVA